MQSQKSRHKEIKSQRRVRKAAEKEKVKRDALETRARYVSDAVLGGAIPVNRNLIQHFRSDDPDFVPRGTYIDLAFECIGCGKAEIWTATQQKWWYEVAHGDRNTTAVRCRPCRKKERERKVEARRVHLSGLAKKKSTLSGTS